MKRTEKPTYTLGQNICYLVKHVWSWDKFFLLCMALNILATLLLALGAIFLPKAVLADLETQAPVRRLPIHHPNFVRRHGRGKRASGLEQWAD